MLQVKDKTSAAKNTLKIAARIFILRMCKLFDTDFLKTNYTFYFYFFNENLFERFCPKSLNL